MSTRQLSREQEEAAFFPLTSRNGQVQTDDTHLVIEAGAGAGKTTLLTERVAWRLLGSDRNFKIDPKDLILVTFSRAAEEELSQRVEKRLQQENLPAEQLEKILSRLHVSTIDSLFTQLSNNLFPLWWEQQRLRLPESTCKEWGLLDQRFPPPMTLVSEDELRPELSECIVQFVQSGAQDPRIEIPLLDFVLAGAFEGQGFHAATQKRFAGLQRITAAMLHENLLRSDAPPLRFALETIHPMAGTALEGIRQLAQNQFYKRLMQGRMTHNDRTLLLYHLLVVKQPADSTGAFWSTESQPAFLQCKEMIVDEYQDTNEIQHLILSSLLEPKTGRMVVVGDPKQSIYGFRSAHVGVFQRLKASVQWKSIELTKNFRSHPDLLPWINSLSDLTFAYRNNKIPEEFLNTEFSKSAQRTFVGSKALDIGRSSEVTESSTQTAPHPRVLFLGASLSKERSTNGIPDDTPTLHAYTSWAIARELKLLNDTDTYKWKDMVVLCETNDWTIKTQVELQALGIPAIAKTSRPANTDSAFQEQCEAIGLILAKWLAQPIEPFEFAQLIWSGWFHTNHEEASHLIRAAGSGVLDPGMISAGSRTSESDAAELPIQWKAISEHLRNSRALAAHHFFSGWQIFRWGFSESVTPESTSMNLAMENFSVALQTILESWNIRRQLEEAAHSLCAERSVIDRKSLSTEEAFWPAELLQTTLNQVRLHASSTDTTQDAVTVCTIHGAKGLEWPVVVFWPSTKRDRPAENFVMKSGASATQVKWLAEDSQSASLLNWIQNPHPPSDLVAVASEGQRGESTQLWSADLQDKLEQDFERQRVFYTAYTRAREMLILVSPTVSGRAQKSLRDKLAPLKTGDEFDPVKLRVSGLESNVMAAFMDRFFMLRKEPKRGSTPRAPWSGREPEAALNDNSLSGLMALKDYGPDWLEQCILDKASADRPAEATVDRIMPSDWHKSWAKTHLADVTESPWRKEKTLESSAQVALDKTNSATEKTSVRNDSTETQDALVPQEPSLSASEQGLRFHALMEHSRQTNGRFSNFMSKFLQSALIREHELELWSDFDLEQSSFDSKKNLLRTQRRILDVFCVIPVSRWPDSLKTVPLVAANKDTIETIQPLLESAQCAEGWLHVVVDFKTGAPKPEHLTQMTQYLAWVKKTLTCHPQLLIGALTSDALFASDDKPLVGILCYTGQFENSLQHTFAQCLLPVDKNTSLLFVSTE